MNNKTVIIKEHYSELSKITTKYKLLPISVFYEIILIAFVFVMLFLKNYIFAIVFGAFFLIFPLLIFLLIKKNLNDSYKKFYAISEKITYIYDFLDTKANVTVSVGAIKREFEIDYNDLKKVVDTGDNLFLFLKNEKSYAVSKSGFDKFDKLSFESLIKPYVKKYLYFKID